MEGSRRDILWEILLWGKNLNLECAYDPQRLTHFTQALTWSHLFTRALGTGSVKGSLSLLCLQSFHFHWLLFFSLEMWLTPFHLHTHTHTHILPFCVSLWLLPYLFFFSLSLHLAKIHKGVLHNCSAQLLISLLLLTFTSHSCICIHSMNFFFLYMPGIVLGNVDTVIRSIPITKMHMV